MIDETAILIIGKWFSKCSKCGRNADSSELHHKMLHMEGEGCGARFTEVGAEYAGDSAEEACRSMRPDLPFIGVYVGVAGADLPRILPG